MSASVPGQPERGGRDAAAASAVPARRPRPDAGPAQGDRGPGRLPATTAAVARREGDRLRFVGAATRRIARGIDLDEIVLGLCRATVPTFSDAILVHLRDPLPVGDERPVTPFVLRLRRTDRLRLVDEALSDSAGGRGPDACSAPGPDLTPASELCEVRTGGELNEVLRGVRPVFAESPAARAALRRAARPGPHRARRAPRDPRAAARPAAGDRRRRLRARPRTARRSRPTTCWWRPSWPRTPRSASTRRCCTGARRTSPTSSSAPCCPTACRSPPACGSPRATCPAAETARVGGDWYDAIPLPGSRVALVVGDVMGHSMTSAAIMGQLRTTAQTLAGLDLPPAEVLHHLDEQAQRLGTDRMATCLYAVYDPVAHRITIANAGHPPPVLLHLGGRAEVLRVPPGAPIGVGGVDFEAVELDAPAGATLLLYTDGLVESRLRDVWTGIEQLRERLAATAQLTGPDHSPPLEALCDDVLDMLGPGDRDDDIALLAARFDGIAPSDVAYWFLDPEDDRSRPGPAAGPQGAGALGPGGADRLGGAAGQRGRHQRRAVRRAPGHAAAAHVPTCCAARSATTRRSCPASAGPARRTRAGAACSWSTAWPGAGARPGSPRGKVVWFELPTRT